MKFIVGQKPKKEAVNFPTKKKEKIKFTPAFFKFLIAFAAIIVASFGVLVLLGNQAG